MQKLHDGIKPLFVRDLVADHVEDRVDAVADNAVKDQPFGEDLPEADGYAPETVVVRLEDAVLVKGALAGQLGLDEDRVDDFVWCEGVGSMG